MSLPIYEIPPFNICAGCHLIFDNGMVHHVFYTAGAYSNGLEVEHKFCCLGCLINFVRQLISMDIEDG